MLVVATVCGASRIESEARPRPKSRSVDTTPPCNTPPPWVKEASTSAPSTTRPSSASSRVISNLSARGEPTSLRGLCRSSMKALTKSRSGLSETLALLSMGLPVSVLPGLGQNAFEFLKVFLPQLFSQLGLDGFQLGPRCSNHLPAPIDRKSTRLNSSHVRISYAV